MHGVGGDIPHGLHTIKHGIYSQTPAPGLERRAQELAREMDARDVAPELAILRAVLEQYVENFDVVQEALIHWHLEDDSERPLNLPTLMEVVTIAKAIAQLSSVLVKNRETEAIPRKAFEAALREMVRIVRQWVLDPEVLENIEAGWREIELKL